MLDHGELRITVTPEFDLDVGHWHTEVIDGRASRIIAPPARPMVDQLIAFIETIPDDGYGQSILTGAVGLASFTVHYGSYYGLLADPGRPLWPLAREPERSLIADAEMRRINIEASAALATLIEIYRKDMDRFWSLLRRAARHLPATRARARRDLDADQRMYLGLTAPEARDLLRKHTTAERWEVARATADGASVRVIANALINGCWRNGAIENVHAGGGDDPLPLNQARVAPAVHRNLFAACSDAMAHALWFLYSLVQGSGRTEMWDDVATALYLMNDELLMYLLGAPRDWSLTDGSTELRLPGREPWSRRTRV